MLSWRSSSRPSNHKQTNKPSRAKHGLARQEILYGVLKANQHSNTDTGWPDSGLEKTLFNPVNDIVKYLPADAPSNYTPRYENMYAIFEWRDTEYELLYIMKSDFGRFHTAAAWEETHTFLISTRTLPIQVIEHVETQNIWTTVGLMVTAILTILRMFDLTKVIVRRQKVRHGQSRLSFLSLCTCCDPNVPETDLIN
eukprot:sb/3470836/